MASGRAAVSYPLSFVLVLVLATSAVGAQETEPEPGARLLAPFKRDLQQALLDGLAQGPEEAIAACRVSAPEIAEALSRDGVRLGRASHRLRNPSNVAPNWVAPILDAYADNPSDRAPRTVSLDNDRSGYVEPIIVQPLCLTCHGDNFAPGVASRLRELYPQDRAAGYQAGDFRGVFWIEFPSRE